MGSTTVSQVISSDGTSIAFERAGDGSPIVFVAGATQYRAIDQTTPQVVAALAADHAVYTYDRRGRGESGDTEPYAVGREIEDLAAVIDEAGGSASVFGMSSGAVLALEAARELAITKLALYEPPFAIDDSREIPDDYFEKVWNLPPGDVMAYFMVQAGGMPEEEVEQFRKAPIWPAFEAVGRTIAYDAEVMRDYSRGEPLPSDRWSSIAARTLVIDGGDSPAWMRNAAQALWEVLPDVRRATLPGQTHAFEPDVLAPVLAEFFA